MFNKNNLPHLKIKLAGLVEEHAILVSIVDSKGSINSSEENRLLRLSKKIGELTERISLLEVGE